VRAQERAVVPSLERRELRDTLLDDLGDPVQDLRPVLGRGPAPRVERGPSRLDRPVRLGLTTAGDPGDDLLVDRRDVVERVRRADAFTTDPVLGRYADALDLGGLARGELLSSNNRSVPNDRNALAELSRRRWSIQRGEPLVHERLAEERLPRVLDLDVAVLVLPRAHVVDRVPRRGDDEHRGIPDRLPDLGPEMTRLFLGQLGHRPQVAPELVEVRSLGEREAKIDQDGHEPSVSEPRSRGGPSPGYPFDPSPSKGAFVTEIEIPSATSWSSGCSPLA
jgi:hypothetical protein